MKLLLILSTMLTVTLAAQEIPALLSEAQRDYLRGDIAAAKEKFTLVQKADPNNRIAVSYLRRIAAEAGKGGVDEAQLLRKAMESTVIDKIEFRDATVSEALEFLVKKIAASSGGKVKVNIVQQLTETEKSARVTLVLNNVPASEALKYVSSLASLKVTYEKAAIVVSSANAGLPVGKSAGGN
jgi:hypothetical protein